MWISVGAVKQLQTANKETHIWVHINYVSLGLVNTMLIFVYLANSRPNYMVSS